MPSQQAQSRIQLNAAIMRSHLTPSEARLWNVINRRQLEAQFRRQVVVGGKYVADFLAAKPKLIGKVDGPDHRLRRSADARRDAKLKRLGYRVLRLEAKLVMQQLPVAVELVRQALAARIVRGGSGSYSSSWSDVLGSFVIFPLRAARRLPPLLPQTVLRAHLRTRLPRPKPS